MYKTVIFEIKIKFGPVIDIIVAKIKKVNHEKPMHFLLIIHTWTSS